MISLTRGVLYKRQELHEELGGQQQGAYQHQRMRTYFYSSRVAAERHSATMTAGLMLDITAISEKAKSAT